MVGKQQPSDCTVMSEDAIEDVAGYLVDHFAGHVLNLPPDPDQLAQTPDGYLWCGTDDGLVRYDGEWMAEVEARRRLLPGSGNPSGGRPRR